MVLCVGDGGTCEKCLGDGYVQRNFGVEIVYHQKCVCDSLPFMIGTKILKFCKISLLHKVLTIHIITFWVTYV